MGCNCKNIKKIEQKMLNNNNNSQDKKGFGWVWNMISLSIQNILIKLLVVLLFIVMTPMVIIVLIVTFLFKGRPFIPLNKKLLKVFTKLDK